MNTQNAGSAFRTTCWTDVLSVKDDDPARAEEALSRLYLDYWRPLYAYARRSGHGPHESEDIVQAFFVALIEKRRLNLLQRDRGRFRSFLLKSLQNFLLNRRDHAQAQKRGGGAPVIPIDDAEAQFRPGDGCRLPEEAYDREWAVQVIANARERLKQEYANAGKQNLFKALSPLLARKGGDGTGQEEAARLGLTEGAFKVALHRLRARFGEMVREEIARTVCGSEDVQDELRHLLRIVGQENLQG